MKAALTDRRAKLLLAGAITSVSMLAASAFAAQPADAQSLEAVAGESADVVGAAEGYVAEQEAFAGEALTAVGSTLQ